MSTAEHPHPAVRRAHSIIEDLSEQTGADLLTCDRCGHEMVVRNTQVTEDPKKNDIRLKCPTTTEDGLESILGVDLDGCGWWTRHGIPISDDEYRVEMADRDHRLVDSVSTPWPASDEPDSVTERLQSLGYLSN